MRRFDAIFDGCSSTAPLKQTQKLQSTSAIANGSGAESALAGLKFACQFAGLAASA
jgi:hypothetical protein